MKPSTYLKHSHLAWIESGHLLNHLAPTNIPTWLPIFLQSIIQYLTLKTQDTWDLNVCITALSLLSIKCPVKRTQKSNKYDIFITRNLYPSLSHGQPPMCGHMDSINWTQGLLTIVASKGAMKLARRLGGGTRESWRKVQYNTFKRKTFGTGGTRGGQKRYLE